MALSPGDPHSYSRPELACVTDIHLELNVDFDQKVLKGKAKLKIARAPTSNEVILDSYGLVISSVTNISTKSNLEYQIGDCGILGRKFTVQLPQVVKHYTNRCEIEIQYETTPNSPALYWLKPEQTTGGKHPFLLSNNKYTFARAVFPCQDTPSVKFTYSADIVVPLNFTVLMSASLSCKHKVGHDKYTYCFSQRKPIPSYAVIIAVGVLQYKEYNSSIGVWVDKYSYSQTADTVLLSLSEETEAILKTAENLCGAYPWGSLDICVLPPSVSHFEIECPCLIFVSPTLLGGDYSLVSSIALNISQHWTGLLVTCSNFEHLWLNNSFSMYIQRRILYDLLHEDMRQFILVRNLDKMRFMIKHFNTLLKLLLTNFIGLLPHNNTKYVLYERGYLLLLDLENKVGGAGVFEIFLKTYLTEFAYKSVETDDLRTCLCQVFRYNFGNVVAVGWNSWLNFPTTFPPGPSETILTAKVASEKVCLSLIKKWIDWNDSDKSFFESTDIKDFCDLQKIYFLNHLRESHILGATKMHIMAFTYQFEDQNDEIRFVWLRLCIKNQWMEKVPAALNFAIKFCSPKFTYPIFQDLYEWKEGRDLAIEAHSREGWKMLDEIKEKVEIILYMNEIVAEIFE